MCIVLMGVADTVYLQHDRRPNLAQEAARLLRSVAAPGDLVIAIDTDKGAYYDLYLCGQGVSVEPINFDIAQAAAERRENQSFTAAVIDELARRVRAAGARGRRCYVDAWVERGAIAPIRDMRDIDVQEFRRLLAATFALQPLDSGTPQLAFAVTAAPTAAPLP